MRPLEGIMVVALEQAVAAPFATRQLADLGARVIKVERPKVGDFARGYDTKVQGLASFFVWLNRGKESLTLDLKHPEGKRILEHLLADADVLVQNLAPGAVERLGFGAEVVREQYPQLIACTVSGYGSSGPYRNRKAYDLLVQAEAGLMAVTGTSETPSKVGISVADIAAGMYAFSGVLTALYQRERTGRGVAFEVSLFDALAEWMGAPAAYTAYGGDPPTRSGASHATIAPYGPFAAGDGRVVLLAVQNEREWARFCEQVLERAELAADPRFDGNAQRVANRRELDAVMEEAFQNFSATTIIERLEAAEIANAQMNSVQQFLEHPQLLARDRWRAVGSPVGPVQTLLPPVAMDGVDYALGSIPALGEHTETILRSLGYDVEQIDELRAASVI